MALFLKVTFRANHDAQAEDSLQAKIVLIRDLLVVDGRVDDLHGEPSQVFIESGKRNP
jgi:hypothetical protein